MPVGACEKVFSIYVFWGAATYMYSSLSLTTSWVLITARACEKAASDYIVQRVATKCFWQCGLDLNPSRGIICEKVASTLAVGGVFAGHSSLLHYLQVPGQD